MATPKLGPDQIAWLVGQVAQYIAAQRAKYAPRANTLSAEQRAAMTGFFPSAVLETGLVQLQNERVQNPDFYPTLRQMGFGNLPDQSASAPKRGQ